ncbi:MAG: fibrobacter succinogenes major paralogous domain-containing protein [Bacteroidales bacterium]|nr:fibrobacter succinogenes major paralogous domain-containing protein [Bacteroidales bacterium]
MKKLLILFLIFMLITDVSAQSPQKMSYQCVIRDASGALVTNQEVGIKISILQGIVTGSVIYEEIHTSTTNTNGLLTIEIGGGTVLSGAFDSIDWADGPYFIKTETDPTGDTNYSITGTSQLLSVPYAFYTNTAGNGFSGDYSDLTNKPALFSGSFPDLSDKPTTISGYGITDAVTISGDQDITGDKTFTGTIRVPAPIDSADAATKAYVDILKAQIDTLNQISLDAGNYGTLLDIDMNIYKTIKIGTQVWMAENLSTTTFRDGTPIPLVTENSEWVSLTTAGRCYYNNDSMTYKNSYGALYNWYTVNTGNLCPAGWHVPADAEWTMLTDYLGGLSVAGGKLKETDTTHWNAPNTGATNETGFTAFPGGFRADNNGNFLSIGEYGYWWSSSVYNDHDAWSRYMYYISSGVAKYNQNKKFGFSIRCLRDY